MSDRKLCESHYRFMCVIWDNEPLSSGELVAKCGEILGWKKSTTYTMLKKLSEKGYASNDNSVVRSLLSRESVQRSESKKFVEQTFSGSLPRFLTAFLGGKTISDGEAEELKKLIDSYREG